MKALGMIETRGLVGAIEASDIALKTADVSIITKTYVKAGLVTIHLCGDVSAVKAAVEAGSEAAKKLGVLISSHVIARPDDSVYNIIYEDKISSKAELTKENGEDDLPESKKENIADKEIDKPASITNDENINLENEAKIIETETAELEIKNTAKNKKSKK